MNTGYAAVNGLKMYYEVHGDGPGRPLVLLPGGLMTIELSFAAILPELAAGRQVIVTELQAHGRTADIDRDMTMAALAGDVAGLLGHLGVAHAEVFGFSLGGGVALQLALDYPELVGRLITASVGYNADGTHAEISDPAHWATSTRMPTAEDFEQMRAAYQRVAPDPGHFEASRARIGQAAGHMSWTAAELGRIGAPTLLIFGDHDFIKLEHAVEMSELISGAQLAVLPGATHMDVLRRADLMIPLIRGFLGR
jgi:pimeloyl-ACP methyl ester carboxylesterase